MEHLRHKEAAEELYTDFYENLWYVDERDRALNAKQCALITTDKILNIELIKDSIDDYYLIFWQKLKQELEKL